MTSEERKEARYQRRKASRQRRREERLKEYDDFDRVKDANNLITAFKKSKSGVDWKASVQRYEMNLLRNINNTVKALESGENVSQGFIVFWLCERGKLLAKSPFGESASISISTDGYMEFRPYDSGWRLNRYRCDSTPVAQYEYQEKIVLEEGK